MKNRRNQIHFEALEARLVLSDTVGPLAASAFAMTEATDSGTLGDLVTAFQRPSFTWNTPADRGDPASGTSTNYMWQVHHDLDGAGYFLMPDESGVVFEVGGGVAATGPIHPLNEGRYIWFVRYQDNAGNWGDWDGVKFRVARPATLTDTIGPRAPQGLSMNYASDLPTLGDFITNSPRPAFNWTEPTDRPDPSSGTSRIYAYQVQERVGSDLVLIEFGTKVHPRWTPGYPPPYLDHQGPNGNLHEGSYIWFVKHQDNNGNWGDWGGVSFRIVTTPTPPPDVTLLNDTNIVGDNFTSDTDLSFSFPPPAGLPEDPFRYREYYWALELQGGTTYDGISQNYFGAFSGTVRPGDTHPALRVMREGRHTMFVRTQDAAGNIPNNWGGTVFTVDTSNPDATTSIRMDSALDWGPINTDQITSSRAPWFNWEAPADTSGSGLSNQFQWQVQDLSSNIIQFGETTGTQLRLPAVLADGTYRLWINAEDRAGNSGNWALIQGGTFTIDATSAGVPNLIGPSDGSVQGSSAVLLWSQATDNIGGSGVWGYQFELIGPGGNNTTSGYLTALTTTVSLSFGTGTYTWRVRSVDLAGVHSAWSTDRTMIVT
jgi:hypothetical protein